MEEVLTLQELSKHLRMNNATIYRLARLNKIPFFKVGNRYRFKMSSIQKWIGNQEK